jgi:hypothetical protein
MVAPRFNNFCAPFLYSVVSLVDKESGRVEHIQDSTRCLEKVVPLLLLKGHFFRNLTALAAILHGLLLADLGICSSSGGVQIGCIRPCSKAGDGGSTGGATAQGGETDGGQDK